MGPDHKITAANEYMTPESAKMVELLEVIQQRPSMYFGKKSLGRSAAFMMGHSFANEPVFVDQQFANWIADKFELPANRGWIDIMVFEFHEEENAFDNFLPVFKEYLQARSDADQEMPISEC
jgi:hypothetical protein